MFNFFKKDVETKAVDVHANSKDAHSNADNVGTGAHNADSDVINEKSEIPGVPRFLVKDYDDSVDINESKVYAEFSLSKPLGDGGIKAVLDFFNASDSVRNDFMSTVYSDKSAEWELGNGSNVLVTDYTIFININKPKERGEFNVFKSVQTMVNFLSKNLSIGVSDIDAVEFFPNPKSDKSHVIFINNEARLDKAMIGDKEKALAHSGEYNVG